MNITNGDLLTSYQKDGFLTGIHIADDIEATYFRKEL